MRIDAPDADEVERLADQWVGLAAEQRAHGTHLLPEENRATVRENLLQRTITGEVLVARDDAGSDAERSGTGRDGDGPEVECGDDGDPDRILGFVSFGRETTDYRQDVDRGLVYNLYVVPDRRGEGIGATLLEAAEEFLADAGADVVALEAMADNEAARRFYRRKGYREHRVELEKPVGDDDSDGGEDA